MHHRGGNIIVFFVIGVILMLGLNLTGGLWSTNKSPIPTPGPKVIPIDTQNNQARQSLQLNSIPFAKVTAQRTPGTGCVDGSGCGNVCHPHENVSSCNECCTTEPCFDWRNISASIRYPEGQPFHCDAKPVIYLYPEKPTEVSVKVKVPGEIVVSDPLYPAGGWRNILSFPNGQFTYQNKTYSELFYEAEVNTNDPPKNGFVIPKENIQGTLELLSTKLGLIDSEKEELVDFWTQKLQTINKPYLMVSVYSQIQKNTFDTVIISPHPDTFIQFILYFKPLENPIIIDPPLLPQTVPQRMGFTAVEWGGIIDPD